MRFICLLVLFVGLHFKADAAPPPLASLFGGGFSLVDQDNQVRTDKDFRGQYMLIYFGYTFCPDVCPTSLGILADSYDALDKSVKDRIQPLFISLDPARDTPAVIKPYVKAFHPDFIGLTGTVAQLKEATKAYRVHWRKFVPEGSDPEKDYAVDHSSLTYLIGPDGNFLTLFPHGSRQEFMVSTINKYLSENK